MFAVKTYIATLTLILFSFTLPAQNITGTWEGDLGSDQFIQLNIIQNGDKICGFTRDYVKADRRSFCKAYFEGTYNKKKKLLSITGRYFLQNSGSHTLMKLNLTYKKVKGQDVFEEKPAIGPVVTSIFDIFRMFDADPFAEQTANSQYVYIKKVSDKPSEIFPFMNDCMDEKKPEKDTVVKIITPKKPKDSLPEIVKSLPPEKKPDSLPVVIVTPEEKTNEIIPVPKAAKERKNIEQSHISVDVKTINLKVYDNAIMDGDTVSILYNGRVLLDHKVLSEKAIEIDLVLQDNQTRHEIILFAHNLGSIPPNTALVVITAGTKRYELFASASLEENAVLVFNYKPKD